MFKRIRWLATGALAGFAGSFWAKRKIQSQIDRVIPRPKSAAAMDSVKSLSSQMKVAFEQGKAEMRSKEDLTD